MDDGLIKTKYYSPGHEKVMMGDATVQIYITCPYGLVAINMRRGTTDSLYYVDTDHQGSILALIRNNGSTAVEYSYDEWGRRRNPGNWNDYTIIPNQGFIDRGYTGHEHYDPFNLIDMNGRVYDPVIGRFLSPDPVIQAPDFTQNFNSYSYCYNNPLKYTDPTGNNVYGKAGYINTDFGTIGHSSFEVFVNGINMDQYNDILERRFIDSIEGGDDNSNEEEREAQQGDLTFNYLTGKWVYADGPDKGKVASDEDVAYYNAHKNGGKSSNVNSQVNALFGALGLTSHLMVATAAGLTTKSVYKYNQIINGVEYSNVAITKEFAESFSLIKKSTLVIGASLGAASNFVEADENSNKGETRKATYHRSIGWSYVAGAAILVIPGVGEFAFVGELLIGGAAVFDIGGKAFNY